MRGQTEILETIKERCIEEGDCWLWQGGGNEKGHPTIKHRSGRRFVWEAVHGVIAEGMRLSVTCGCIDCLNPKHLALRTRAQITAQMNAQPSVRRKKSAGGARGMKAYSKLDADKARYIRESDKTQRQLAEEFGVSQPLISRVRLYQSWLEHESPFAALMR